MKIVATSDFHGYLPEIPECDILLIAGDVCPVWDHRRQFQAEWLKTEFKDWMFSVPAEYIVWTGGNHDFVLEEMKKSKIDSLGGIYLNNSDIEIDGTKIWGSPLSPKFGDWAFMRDDRGLAEIWEKIPSDVDILMVHGPMFEYVDLSPYGNKHVGSQSLRNRLDYGDFPNLKLFVCGHIHDCYGTVMSPPKFEIVNASHVNESYNPVNPPLVIEL